MKIISQQTILSIIELFGSASDSVIVLYLLSKIDTSVDIDRIQIKTSEISLSTGLNYRTVRSTLDKLQTIGIIKLDGKSCTVYTFYVYSLALSYQKLAEEDKATFKEAFRSCDLIKMSLLGFAYITIDEVRESEEPETITPPKFNREEYDKLVIKFMVMQNYKM